MSFWQGRAARLGVCLVLWLATGAYLLPFVDRGWIAHDDGMLGQAAERVMAGELPHRDFYDPHRRPRVSACARIQDSWCPAGIPSVAAFCRDARMGAGCLLLVRAFRSPISAALVTAVAVAWSVPNYFASMPSYYNLFLATFGTRRCFVTSNAEAAAGWCIAGCCGGLSFLVKSVGIFFLVAGGLFLLFRAQIESRRDAEVDDRPSTGFLVLETAGCVGLIMALVAMLGEPHCDGCIALRRPDHGRGDGPPLVRVARGPRRFADANPTCVGAAWAVRGRSHRAGSHFSRAFYRHWQP